MAKRAVKQKRPILDDEERQKKLHQLFYLGEAFLENGDSAQSMNTLVPKLLGAKSLAEVEEVYRQHIVDHQALGQSVFLLDIAIRDYYMEQEGFDDPTPIYAKWLYYAARKASAFCELYTVCLRVLRKESKKSAVINIMDMMFFATKAFDHMLDEIRNKEYTLRDVYDQFRPLYPDYCDIPAFPLVFFFKTFQDKIGKDLQKEYDCPYHQTSIQERFQFRYWEDFQAVNATEVEDRLRELLWEAARKSKHYDRIRYLIKSWNGETRFVDVYHEDYGECLKRLRLWDDKWLAERILGILDRYTEKQLSDGIQLKIDSATRKITASSTSIDSALFLWIITQIQDTENCQICKICGRVFKLQSQKTRRYCYLHSAAAIDYFNRKLRKKQQEKEGEEGPQLTAD
jgi:hypothetical protein